LRRCWKFQITVPIIVRAEVDVKVTSCWLSVSAWEDLSISGEAVDFLLAATTLWALFQVGVCPLRDFFFGGGSVAAVEAAGWLDTSTGSLTAGLGWSTARGGWSTAVAAVAALAASDPAVVAAAVVDATVCVDFFLRSHCTCFCLRLWFAGRCLPCFLEVLAAVEVWHTSRVSTAPHTVLNSSLAAMPLTIHD
jgi:hypothetical protein